MYFIFTVQVEVERREGKFVSRDELEGLIAEALANADEGEWQGDDGGLYDTISFDVEHDDATFKAMEANVRRNRRLARKARKAEAQS